jgi:ATP-dependent helicase/nuclease subunit A
LPLPAALEKVVADLGLMALAGSRPGGDVEAGSLAKAIEILRDEQGRMWTSEQVMERLGELVRLEAPYDGISARSGDRPLVRIMNLHKVKGLEAPVVFLADPSGEYDHGVQAHIDRSGDCVLGHMLIQGPKRAYQQPVLAHPEGWEGLADKEKAFARAEALRLRYVAATRAGRALVVSRRLGRGKTRLSPWKGFEPYLTEQGELPDPGSRPSPENRRQSLSQTEIGQTCEELASRLETATSHTVDVEAAKRYALKSSLEDGTSSGLQPAEDGEHGVEWGTVIHMLLQVAMENPESDLQGLARTVLAEQGLEVRLAEGAVETVNSVMKAEIWGRAMASQRRLAEIPFEILLEREASVPVLVRGSIDLVFEESDGWVIVDYKTDSIPIEKPEALVDKYAPQVRLYAESWERITGEKVKEMGLYFSRSNLFAPIVIPAKAGIS